MKAGALVGAGIVGAGLFYFWKSRHLTPSSEGSPFHGISGSTVEEGGRGGTVTLTDGRTIPYTSQVDLDQITSLAAMGAL